MISPSVTWYTGRFSPRSQVSSPFRIVHHSSNSGCQCASCGVPGALYTRLAVFYESLMMLVTHCGSPSCSITESKVVCRRLGGSF